MALTRWQSAQRAVAKNLISFTCGSTCSLVGTDMRQANAAEVEDSRFSCSSSIGRRCTCSILQLWAPALCSQTLPHAFLVPTCLHPVGGAARVLPKAGRFSGRTRDLYWNCHHPLAIVLQRVIVVWQSRVSANKGAEGKRSNTSPEV